MTMESPEEKMSRIEQEEIFRQDREAKEKIIRDGIAVKVRPWERSSVFCHYNTNSSLRFAPLCSAPLLVRSCRRGLEGTTAGNGWMR